MVLKVGWISVLWRRKVGDFFNTLKTEFAFRRDKLKVRFENLKRFSWFQNNRFYFLFTILVKNKFILF